MKVESMPRSAPAWLPLVLSAVVAACGSGATAPADAPPAAAPTVAVVTPVPAQPYTGGVSTPGYEATVGAGAADAISPTIGVTATIASGTRPEDLLPGPPWLWRGQLMTNGTQQLPDDPSKYTLTFHPDGTVAVVADCNQAAGTYTIDGSKIAISGLTSTLAACPAGSLSAEFIADLGMAKHVVVNPAVLTLMLDAADGSHGEMKLLRAGLR